MIVLVDTSVWVEHLRGTETPATRVLIASLRSGEDLVTTGPVVMELLAGADTERRAEVIDQLISGLRQVALDEDDFRRAAGIFRAVRRQGRTVRSLVDCLIAAAALRLDAVVLHRDADYEAIAAATGLRVQRA